MEEINTTRISQIKKDLNIIKRIKAFSLLAFIFPLIAINLCWIIYYYIGTLKTYRDIPWNNKETTSNALKFAVSDETRKTINFLMFAKQHKTEKKLVNTFKNLRDWKKSRKYN